MSKNIVHQYFKKELEGAKILLKLNPIHLLGVELTIPDKGEPKMQELEFENNVVDILKADGFMEVNPIEFNLYVSGLL